jgi:RNA polymerase sigma factor (sigma-70 family)
MTTSQLKVLLGCLRRSAELRETAGLTDGELLDQFMDRRDGAAFESLVRRHGGMVLGVCRRVLPTHQDAEDAFQVTFLVLARRAGVVPRDKVGNWLHGVACRTAHATRRLIVRRRAIGMQVSELPHPAAPEEPREDLRPLLDEELGQLPEKYRLPLLLCDLGGVARRDAARQLGIPDGTLSNRLAEARRRLALRLARRGLAPLAGAVASFLVPQAQARFTETMVASVIATARGATAPPALASLLPIASLTQGGIQIMWLSQLKIMLGLALLLAAVAGGIGALRSPVPGFARATGSGAAPAAKPPADKPPEPAPEPAMDEKTLARIRATLHEASKEFAATEDDGSLRHRLLGDMGVLQARLGDRAGARRLFRQAGDLVAAFDERRRSNEWRMLARAQAKAGEADDAIVTVRRIPAGDQFRDISFAEASTELAKGGREKDAFRLCDLVEGEKTKAWSRRMVLVRLALAHARSGDMRRALRVLDRIEDPASKVDVLIGVVISTLTFVESPHEPGIALIHFQAGNKGEAGKSLRRAEIAATVTTNPAKDRALAAVACAQARMGDLDAARKSAASVTDEKMKPMALAAIARAQGKAGLIKQALAEIDKVPDQGMRAHILIHLGAGRASGGDKKGAAESFRRARGLIEKLPKEGRGHPTHNLASAQGEAGDYEGARETAASLPEGSLGGINIAFAQAKAGDFPGALKAAVGMKDSSWSKGELLRAIARQQTLREGEKAARAWIGVLGSPLARANALLGVAEALAKAEK